MDFTAIERYLGIPRLLLVSCILLTACAASSQSDIRAEIVAPTKSKQELAREVIAEIGIDQRYDLHFMAIVDMSLPTIKPQVATWLHQIIVQGAGWKRTEAKYIARLESDFTEVELQELLNLAKQPLLKKLLKSEFQAYKDVGPERRKLMNQVWEDYQSGKFSLPASLK